MVFLRGAGNGPTLEADLQAIGIGFRAFEVRVLLLLAAAGLFGGLFSGERADRTLHYVFLQPVRREVLAAGKYVAAVLLLWAGASVFWILTMGTWLLPHGAGHALAALLWGRGLADAAACVLVLLLGCIAYGGLFILAGSLTRAPALVALALLGWESACSVLPVAFQRFTVFYWLDSLMPVRVPFGSTLSVLAERAPWPLAVLVALVIGVAGLAGAAWRARTMEVSYGASE
jgi:ABC-type transport system involved in multi-copper enzyme maturation permease subunit